MGGFIEVTIPNDNPSFILIFTGCDCNFIGSETCKKVGRIFECRCKDGYFGKRCDKRK